MTNKQSERGKVIAEAIEAAREYLYRSCLHHQGDFHAILGSGGFIDLAEVLGCYAVIERNAGYKAGIEAAAKDIREEFDRLYTWSGIKPLVALTRAIEKARSLAEGEKP